MFGMKNCASKSDSQPFQTVADQYYPSKPALRELMALIIEGVQHDNLIGLHFQSTVIINLINVVSVIVSA